MGKQRSLVNLFYNIAYAIRNKTNNDDLLTPREFSKALEAIDTTNVQTLKEKIVNRSFTSAELSNVTTIGSYAFQNCSQLASISFPNCNIIENNAFKNCTALKSAIFPKCKQINSNMDPGNWFNLDAAVAANEGAFMSCESLITANFPECLKIGGGTFYGCTNLTTISFPKCTTIQNGAFLLCGFSKVSFPKVKNIGKQAFMMCSNLRSIVLPSTVTTLEEAVFTYCFQLSQVTLEYQGVVSISSSDIFTQTPYAGMSTYFSGTPKIYVPQSYVQSYKLASFWSFFSKYIYSIT